MGIARRIPPESAEALDSPSEDTPGELATMTSTFQVYRPRHSAFLTLVTLARFERL
jgi:hypothetical protein